MRAILVEEFGGPEVLQWVEVDDPEPGPGELQIAVSSAGLNFADTHQVENTYLVEPTLPFVPGAEAVGVVVSGPRAGERVAGAIARAGGYRERALLVESRSYRVPDGIDDVTALSLLSQGQTAYHLLRSAANIQPGESVLINAAAGGVGSIAVQLGKAWGARVVGTSSSPEKVATVLAMGADAAVQLAGDETAEQVTELVLAGNDGKPFDVILEMVGGPVFDGCLAALGRGGRILTYGNAARKTSTPVAPRSLLRQAQTLIGFMRFQYEDPIRHPGAFESAIADMLELIADGTLRLLPGHRYPITECGRAFEDMRGRKTMGKAVLVLE